MRESACPRLTLIVFLFVPDNICQQQAFMAMTIPGLTIIGESINDSVPSTHVLFEKNNMAGIIELAKS